MRNCWFVLLFVNIFSFAQSQTALNNCKQYLHISDSIYYSDPDSSYVLDCLAEKCAAENKDSALLARAIGSKGKYLLLKSMLEDAGLELNRAYTIYLNQKDTSGMAYILKLRSILQERIGNLEECVKLQEESIRLYMLCKNYKDAYTSLLNISYQYIYNGELDKARKSFATIDS